VNYNTTERLQIYINWNFIEVANCCPKAEKYFEYICAAQTQNHRNIYIITLRVSPFQHRLTGILLKNTCKMSIPVMISAKKQTFLRH